MPNKEKMPYDHLNLKEEEVIKIILEFMENRNLYISQVSLERESGVINKCYTDDLLFLRQLIVDGQWDDVLEFIQPLENLNHFNKKQFRYYILKQQYLELLCIKSEAGIGANMEAAVQQVIAVLNHLETCSPSAGEYSELYSLLSIPHLALHKHYKNWNPISGRMQCFKAILPLVEGFMTLSSSVVTRITESTNDRLMQLIIKGIIYESCVEFCQKKATQTNISDLKYCDLLSPTGFLESDLSLVSWLQSIPAETFSCPFEPRTLNVDVERLEQPILETSWTEQILVTPIKPNVFPYSAMPACKPRSAEMMSRSLLESSVFHSTALNNSEALDTSVGGISKSLASFHLTGRKAMDLSVDRLFEERDLSNSLIKSSNSQKASGVNAAPKPMERFHNQSNHQESFGNNLFREYQRQKIISDDTQKPKRNDPRHRSFQTDQSAESVVRTDPRSISSSNIDARSKMNQMKQLEELFGKVRLRAASPGSQNTKYGSPPKFPGDDRHYRNTECPVHKNPEMTRNNDTKRSFQSLASPPPVDYRSTNVAVRKDPIQRRAITKAYPNEKRWSTDSIEKRESKGSIQNLPPPETNDSGDLSESSKPQFVPVTCLQDTQVIRCASFHPSGKIYAVGTNSRALRICAYPDVSRLGPRHETQHPTVLFKRTKHHKGSVYCVSWSPAGDLIATGSNDKSIKLMHFDSEQCDIEGEEVELYMHDGTVRDLCFIEDMSNHSSLLVSGGSGDCKIYITDCMTSTAFQSLAGHSGHILSLYTWGGAMFVSGSQDRSVRFWDLRTGGCINILTPQTISKQGSPVTSVCVDPSGRMLVSGHEDASCVLYDIRGNRTIQVLQLHTQDVRAVRFSYQTCYLLTGSYDGKLLLTDLQGDLTQPLPSILVGEHQDKVTSAHWHPSEFSFLSTSTDGTAVLWALPTM